MSYNQDIIEMLKQQESTLTGAVDPTSITPEFIGQIYINTTADTVWVAKSIAIGDWIETGSGSGGGAITGIVGGDKYVDRGDPSGWDFTSGDFTKDAVYRDLDLSSVLPPEAAGKLVHLTVQVNTTVAGGAIYLRTKGNSDGYGIAGVNSAEANKVHTEDVLVKCDDYRAIQYYVATGYTWNNLDMVVRGWYKEELVDTELIGEEFVNRGDPSAYDWVEADFTKGGVWYELDASSVLPPEAAGQLVLFRLGLTSSSTSDYLQIREKGNSQPYNAAYIRGTVNTSDYWVRCDANRKFEYRVNEAGTIYTLTALIRGWNIPKVGGSRNPIIGGDEYVDRGDPAAYDFAIGDFVVDSAWHELDLSSIVPSEAANKQVQIRAEVRNTTIAGANVFFREVGNSNQVNMAKITTQAANVLISEDRFIKCDSSRKIEYYVQSTGTWDRLDVTVRGWEKQATIDHLVRGDEYVNRGDPSVYDWTSFTTDATWHELDLSSVLPVEAAGQLVHVCVQLQTPTAGAGMYLRPTGRSNLVDISRGVCPVANQKFDYTDFWVLCDENRKIEYLFSNTTWTVSGLAVRGWMKTSDGGAIAGTKYVDRGTLSAYDFTVGDLTLNGTVQELDLSSIIPPEAANQMVYFQFLWSNTNTSSTSCTFREKGGSTYNGFACKSVVGSRNEGAGGWVKCDANRKIEYQATNVAWSQFNITVRGWMQPIDKGQAIQPTYGAPVVHVEWKDVNTVTVKAGRYFVDGGWYELESDLDWTWAASGQNFGVDTGTGEANGWWYLYMFLYGDRPAVVASQTPPTAAYDTDLSGTAYDKNIYLGAYYNDAGSIRGFYQSGREFFYFDRTSLVSTTSSSWQAKTIAVPATADQVIGLINLNNSGSSTPGNAYYSPNTTAAPFVGPRNNESSTNGHYDQFVAPVVTPQTGYIRNDTGAGTNTAQMWTLGWKDKWMQ